MILLETSHSFDKIPLTQFTQPPFKVNGIAMVGKLGIRNLPRPRQVGGGYGALVQKAGRVGLSHQRPLARWQDEVWKSWGEY